MIADAIAGLNAVKTAFELAKGLKDINDAAMRNAAIIDLQTKILDAQHAQSELLERLSRFEKEIDALNSWNAQAERYQLRDFGGGTFAYELMEEKAFGEPTHRVCPTCFASKRRSILQGRGRSSYQQDVYFCHACNVEFYFGQKQADSYRRVVRPDPLAL